MPNRRYGRPKVVKGLPRTTLTAKTSTGKEEMATERAEDLLSPDKNANLTSYLQTLEEMRSSGGEEKDRQLPLLRKVYDPTREKTKTLAGMQLLAVYNSMKFQYGRQASIHDDQSIQTYESSRKFESAINGTRRQSSVAREESAREYMRHREDGEDHALKHKAMVAERIVNDIPQSLQLTNEGLWSQDQTTEERVPVYQKEFTPNLPDVFGHSDLIVDAVFVPAEYSFGFNYDRYITADRSGIVCVWSVNDSGNGATFRQAFRAGPKQITAMSYMYRSSVLLVATVDNEIILFELSYLTGSVTKRGTITSPRLQHCMPVSLFYFLRWQSDEKNKKNISGRGASNAPKFFSSSADQMLLDIGVDPDQAHDAEVQQSVSQGLETQKRGGRARGVLPDGDEVLLVGDNVGGMHMFSFSHKGWTVGTTFLSGNMLGEENPDDPASGVKSVSQVSGTYQYDVMNGVKISRHHAHDNGWVTTVKYIPLLAVYITGSERGEIKVWDALTMQLISEYGHHHSIMDFDWSPGYRLLAFCCGDRQLTLWNPFSRKRQTVLHGHFAPVVSVKFVDSLSHLLALCKDGSIKVWNSTNFRSAQTFREDVIPSGIGDSWIPKFHVYPKANTVVTFSTKLVFWPLETPAGILGSNRASIVQILFNYVFNKIMTVEGQSGSVSNWNVLDGKIHGKLSKIHGNSSITAAAIDSEGRRLVTGTSEGDLLKVSNIHNPGKPLGLLRLPLDMKPLYRTSDKIITAIVTFDRVVFPTGGIGQATVAKYVCCARSDGYIFLFREPYAESSGESNAEERERLSPRSDAACIRPTSSKSPVHRAKQLADQSVLSQRRRIASRLGVQLRTDALEDTEAQGPFGKVMASSSRQARGNVRREYNKKQQAMFNTFDLASGKYKDINLGKLKQEANQMGIKVQQDIEDSQERVVDDSSPLIQKDDSVETSPQNIFPTSSNIKAKHYHRDMISSLIFIPPHFIVSAGYDGSIQLWSIITGRWEREIFQASASSPLSLESFEQSTLSSRDELTKPEAPTVEDIVYIPSLNCIAAVGEAPKMHVCNFNDPQHFQEYNVFVENNVYCKCVTCDSESEMLAVGDSSGNVTIWDVVVHPEGMATDLKHTVNESDSEERTRSHSILGLESSESRLSLMYNESFVGGQPRENGECGINGILRPLSRWGAGKGSPTTDVKFVYSERIEDVVIATSHSNGCAHLWNVAGSWIGTFGCGETWSLNKRLYDAAYKRNVQQSGDFFRPELHRQFFIREGGPRNPSGECSSGSRVTSRIPSVGDVWIRRPIQGGLKQRKHFDKLSSDTVPSVSDDLLNSHNWVELTAMITVTRVTTEYVLGWDGMSGGKDKMWVPLKEFVSPDVRRTDPWHLHIALTARIGRIFDANVYRGKTTERHSEPFKVRNVYVQKEDSECTVRVRDIFERSWSLPRLLNRSQQQDPSPDHIAIQWTLPEDIFSQEDLSGDSLMELAEVMITNSALSTGNGNQKSTAISDWLRCIPENLPPRHWYAYHPLYFLPRRSIALHQRDENLLEQWVRSARDRVRWWEKLQSRGVDKLSRLHKFASLPPVIPPVVCATSFRVLTFALQSHASAAQDLFTRLDNHDDGLKYIPDSIVSTIASCASDMNIKLTRIRSKEERSASQATKGRRRSFSDRRSTVRLDHKEEINLEEKHEEKSAATTPDSKSRRNPRDHRAFIKRFERSPELRRVLAPTNMWNERVQAAYNQDEFLARKVNTVRQSLFRGSQQARSSMQQTSTYRSGSMSARDGADVTDTTITGFSWEPKAKLHIPPGLDNDGKVEKLTGERDEEEQEEDDDGEEQGEKDKGRSPHRSLPFNLRVGVQSPVDLQHLPRDYKRLLPKRTSKEVKDSFWKKNLSQMSTYQEW